MRKERCKWIKVIGFFFSFLNKNSMWNKGGFEDEYIDIKIKMYVIF